SPSFFLRGKTMWLKSRKVPALSFARPFVARHSFMRAESSSPGPAGSSFLQFCARATTENAAMTAFIIAAFSVVARAQNCKKLEPAGPGLDDSARINECLATKGRAKLKAGTFLLFNHIVFPRRKKDGE